MRDKTALYQRIASMEPLLPDSGRTELAKLSQKITYSVGELMGMVHSPIVRDRIATLVRSVNCYYSNLIAGHRYFTYVEM